MLRRAWMSAPALATLLIVPVPASAQAQPADEKVVQVFQEPRHHLVVDTPTLRIVDIQIPPGDTTLYHKHDSAMLYVPIASSRTRNQNIG